MSIPKVSSLEEEDLGDLDSRGFYPGVHKDIQPAVLYIMEFDLKSKCDPIVLMRALSIYHDTMRRVGDIQYDPAIVAASALYLSSTVENDGFELNEFLYLFYHVVKKNVPANILPGSEELKVFKESFVEMELIMLRTLKYNLKYDLAHQYLRRLLNYLHNKAKKEAGFFYSMNKICFKVMLDFYISGLCLKYKAEDICVACIDTALHFHGFIQHLEMLHPWHEGFCADLTEEKVKTMKKDAFRLYINEGNYKLSPRFQRAFQ